jgi:hypothetical protein
MIANKAGRVPTLLRELRLTHDFLKALERKLTKDAIKWYLEYDDFILALEEGIKTIVRIEADSVSEEDMRYLLESEDDADDAHDEPLPASKTSTLEI